ncbi:acyltransferase family protein [Leucobacter triazinivorans]|uniref:Acetyltransferase n=1 Tax=Leucobacter triazinivorans TaxID=1784719 RepID=A0A4P6KDT2_9MICO|nr:acyltransferase family protein [Leucobacter triazinivorans]QBE48091.1 acetyltransferase [Leucobacter triazinivorans]
MASSSTDQTPARSRRFGGLDGLRAIAVGLVVWYHLFPAALPGGFLGVDVFFVISGFLITSLLLREIQQHGRIRLGAFWRRRARRLLPALALVLLVSTGAALLVGGDLLVGIAGQLGGAAFFVSNWVYIATGADYFARDTPELFRNTWSLSIEEQFYIVLPLLLLVLVRARGRGARALSLVILGLLSAALMWGLSLAGVDPTRIYFGSDSHTFGLFLGAAMAVLLHRGAQSPAPDQMSRSRQLITGGTALVGMGVLGWLAWTLPEAGPASFEGGFQLATAAALAIVWGVTRPGAWAGRALDAAPLRWIGERSYGIYLWHWPLLIIFGAAFGSGAGWIVPALTLLVTLLFASASYRFVEQPVRRFGLRRSLRLLVRTGDHSRRQRLVAIGLGALLAATVPATAYAVVTAPQQSSAAAAVARGQAALERSGTDAAETPGPTDAERDAGSAPEKPATATAPGSDEPEAHRGPASPPAAGEDAAAAIPISPDGRDISAVGDSVMLASLPELEQALPGIAVDAAVSRGMGAGVGIVSELSSQGTLRSVLVVGLGTNGPVQPEDLEAIRQTAGVRPVVLVNAHADRDWIPGVNQTLADFAAAHRGIVLADWDGAVSGVPDALAGDDIHPNPSGGEIYAASVQRALDELQQPGEALGFALPRR